MVHLLIWGIAIFLCCVVIAIVSNPDSNNNSNSKVSKSDSSLHKVIGNSNNSVSDLNSLMPKVSNICLSTRNSDIGGIITDRSQRRRKAMDLFEEGKKARAEGKIKQALNNFDNAISLTEILKEPNANYYYYRALVHVELIKYNKAIEDYSNAISIEPLHIYYNNRGVLKNEIKDYTGAIDDYSKAILIKPNNHLSLVNRGKCHFDFGYLILAKLDWENAAERGDLKAKKYLDQHFKDAVKKAAPIGQRMSKISPAVHLSSFKPKVEDVFRITKSNDLYTWYAVFDYFPKNRFSESQLSALDLQVRQHVYKFKDGINPKYYAEMFASAFLNMFGSSFFKGKVILIVPASNKEKTLVRFGTFCKLLSDNLGAINGFGLLNNNEKDKMPSHNGGNRNEDLEQYLTINDSLRMKELIIIDDVRTSGSSSNQIFSILKKKGVSNMTFAYLARTVSLNSPINSIEIDDLPF